MDSYSKNEFRGLPSTDRMLADHRLAPERVGIGREALADLAREVLSDSRSTIADGAQCPTFDDLVAEVSRRARRLSGGLRRVINATGVVLHTNLGRAPMSEEAIEAMSAASRGFLNLELDLDSGQRGTRHAHLEPLLCQMTKAEAAIVVNNNASAVLLGLMALARGKEVIVSRGQAVQIGGGVRIPDIMRQSGAKLVEVGTTNVTTAGDYADAITSRTAAILRVHSSNFRIVGFTEQASLPDLVSVANRNDVWVLDDIGSGCLIDATRYGLSPEPTAQESIKHGADMVFFSGDKLLGGPQAGIVVGKKTLVDRMKRHPLARAVRIDKTRIAGLGATLAHYLRDEAESKIPVWMMISLSLDVIEGRARRWANHLANATVERGESLIGGGSLPGNALPTYLTVIKEPARQRERKKLPEIARRLREGDPALVCRIDKDRMLIDPRTVLAGEEEVLLTMLKRELLASGMH